MAFTLSPTSSGKKSIGITRYENGIHTWPMARTATGTLQRHISSSSSLPVFNSLDNNVGSTDLTGTGSTYEAILPPTTTLVGMGIIVVLCVIGGWVWANQVVPTSRAKLALSKSRGEVKEYLDELKASETLDSTQYVHHDEVDVAASTNAVEEEADLSKKTFPEKGSRKFERWLFTDWLLDNKSARISGRRKEAALPILKEAKWNSGDNPVLAASALIGMGVLFTTLTERVASLI